MAQIKMNQKEFLGPHILLSEIQPNLSQFELWDTVISNPKTGPKGWNLTSLGCSEAEPQVKKRHFDRVLAAGMVEKASLFR